jgi:hypothetical protein
VASAGTSIPIGPVSIVIAASLGGSYGINGELTYALDHGFGTGGVTTGKPKASAGAAVTPHVAVDGSLYIGVGFDIGIASASIGVEGQVTFFDLGVPVYTNISLTGDSFTDLEARNELGSTRDASTSDWAGNSVGIPHDHVYKWGLNWTFGSRLEISTLSGKLNAAARVRFLFFSKTFRKKLLEWQGPSLSIPIAEATFDVSGGLPIPSGPDLVAAISPDMDLGFSGEQVGYNEIEQLPGQQYVFTTAAANDICTPVPGPVR